MSREGGNHRCQQEGQGVVYDEELHDAGHAPEEGNEDGENAVHEASGVLPNHGDDGAEEDAEEKTDEGHEKSIGDGLGDEEEGSRKYGKINHQQALLSCLALYF